MGMELTRVLTTGHFEMPHYDYISNPETKSVRLVKVVFIVCLAYGI